MLECEVTVCGEHGETASSLHFTENSATQVFATDLVLELVVMTLMKLIKHSSS